VVFAGTDYGAWLLPVCRIQRPKSDGRVSTGGNDDVLVNWGRHKVHKFLQRQSASHPMHRFITTNLTMSGQCLSRSDQYPSSHRVPPEQPQCELTWTHSSFQISTILMTDPEPPTANNGAPVCLSLVQHPALSPPPPPNPYYQLSRKPAGGRSRTLA